MLSRTSRSPWTWGYTYDEKETNEPDIRKLGIKKVPTAPVNIQLKSNGEHRFWVELTDTQLAGDIVFDFDFIIEAREFVPELIAEIDRLRGLLGRESTY